MGRRQLDLRRPEITNANQLSDTIGTPRLPGPATVVQALDWDTSIQNFQAWANVFGFGDNFLTIVGYPYIVCLSDNAPPSWL